MGDEGGLLLCSWPKGGQPHYPLCTAMKYGQVSNTRWPPTLCWQAEVEEGLDIVANAETGMMAQSGILLMNMNVEAGMHEPFPVMALMQGLTGFCYDAVDKTLYIDSKIGDFTSFVSTNSGFGTVSLKGKELSLNMAEGKLEIDKVIISGEPGKFI